MNHRCKCGSDRFIRRWAHVHIHTPCTFDTERMIVRMDFSNEEQVDDNGSFREFYCAECSAPVSNKLERELLREYEYE